MRLALFALLVGFMSFASVPSADARPFWEESDQVTQHTYRKKVKHHRSATYQRSSYRSSGAGPRPRRWCGWWMRTQLGGGPEFNLARNWRRWGRPAGGPQVGAVVVWNSHVGMITGRAANGQWIVKSGNDGGRVRERARSVSGATFRVG